MDQHFRVYSPEVVADLLKKLISSLGSRSRGRELVVHVRDLLKIVSVSRVPVDLPPTLVQDLYVTTVGCFGYRVRGRRVVEQHKCGAIVPVRGGAASALPGVRARAWMFIADVSFAMSVCRGSGLWCWSIRVCTCALVFCVRR